ncbi:MAG TPA: efflux RND transporter periplasmic adaptor subunit, partial [Thermoanaerobaculia bacterium]
MVAGVGVTLTLAALSVGWQGCQGKKSEPVKPPPPPAVVVAPVVQADVPVIREWIGTTEGNVNAEIRPKVDGYLLRRVYAEGSLVHQGDLLFTIDPRQTQAQLEQAQADLAQAQAQLSKAQQDVARFRPLVAGKAISQQELDNALSAERAAKAAADARQAAVHQARLSQEWARVTSPISGIAGVAQQQVGDLVSPATVLTTVSQCDPIRVTYQLSEQEYLAFQRKVQQKPEAGQENNLEMILADGSVFPHKGRVLFEGRQVEVKTGTIAVVALFPNPGNLLRPGQYAKVRGVTEVRKGALLVPQRAVNDLQGGSQVAVVGSDNKAEIRTVQTGERMGNRWVIESGLHPGDRVVVEGFTRVKSGVVVNPTEAPPEPAAASTPAPAGGK